MTTPFSKQRTLKQSVEISGTALHSGRYVTAVLNPAPADTGIVFERVDVKGCNRLIPATIDHAVQHSLCTRIENTDGVKVQTIEHFMAAFHGLNIDNVHIEIDGSELPILDGSAMQITERLKSAGIQELDADRNVMVVKQAIEFEDAFCRVDKLLTIILLSPTIFESICSAISANVYSFFSDTTQIEC